MEVTENKYQELFNKQKAHQFEVANTTYKERLQKLNILQHAVEVTYRFALQEALYKDFKKPAIEADLTEIYPVIGEIKFAKKNLRKWMQRKKVATPMALLGSSSWVHYEPKGVCLLISPWNFPVNLTLGPLVSAIAAGNTVIIKPSEMTPHTTEVLATLVSALFDENEIALVKGDAAVSQALLALPFHHIFFTGSPMVGKIVMAAAAKNLTSVTLELGGKSPTIVDASANLTAAAKRIVWGKFINNGQICVSPDYVFVHKDVQEAFVAALQTQIQAFYGDQVVSSPDYCRIVNDKHHARLVNHIEDAKEKGANIVCGGTYDASQNYIAPTILTDVPEEASVLKEEIFGPLLPVKTYADIDEVLTYINEREKPLALYVFSNNKKNTQYIIDQTRAGSTCVNNCIVQYSNHNLPFGGSNHSGIGKTHGRYGFQEFSNSRSVLKQHIPGAIEQLFPPYTSFKETLVKLTVKWF